MTAVRVALLELSSRAPFYQGSTPQLVDVSGTASRGCARLRVTVSGSPGSVLLSRDDVLPTFQSVPTGADASAPEHDGRWTATLSFDPEDSRLTMIRCGSSLLVEAQCISTGFDGFASDVLSVRCKGIPECGCPEPSSSGSRGDPTSRVDATWPWPSPPSIMCRIWRAAYGTALSAAFVAFATAACWPSGGFFGLAAVAIAVASAAHLFWRIWCAPSACEVWGVVCWSAKNSAMFAFALAAFAWSATGLVAVAAIGAIAGLSIAKLDYYRCPVPAAGAWPY